MAAFAISVPEVVPGEPPTSTPDVVITASLDTIPGNSPI